MMFRVSPLLLLVFLTGVYARSPPIRDIDLNAISGDLSSELNLLALGESLDLGELGKKVDFALVQEFLNGVKTTVVDSVLSRVISRVSGIIKNLEKQISSTVNQMSSNKQFFTPIVQQGLCGLNILLDGISSALANVLIDRLNSNGYNVATITIYMTAYKYYSDRAIDALASINESLKNPQLASGPNGTCSNYRDKAQANIEAQGKRIAEFYKGIPGDIAGKVKDLFGNVFGKFKQFFGNVFDNLFGGLLNNLPLPKLPSFPPLPQLPSIPPLPDIRNLFG